MVGMQMCTFPRGVPVSDIAIGHLEIPTRSIAETDQLQRRIS